MPTMWFVKEGPRSNATRGSGAQLSFDEIRRAFKNSRPEFLSTNPPRFNVNTPSQFPVHMVTVHVVIEVHAEDGVNPEFPRSGFYIMDGLSPERARQLLFESRGV